MKVQKRSGLSETFDLDKIHKVLFWATENITKVSVSEVEISAQMQLYEGMNTSEIHEALIRAAADLISEESPNYQFVASRLINISLRKQVYGGFTPPTLMDHIKACVDVNVYDSGIMALYSTDEWEIINKMIVHNRDDMLTYAAMEQFRGKYLVRDRTTNIYYETPQMAYILIAAILFSTYPPESRIAYVKDCYDAISKGSKSSITLPTPVMAGVRTPTRQFSSCVLVESGDSLESINETASTIVDYASRRAGLGINVGRIRSIGSSVKNGEVFHTGNIPFYKYFLAALKSCSQGGVRSASATVFYPVWTYEVEDLLVLKNNKGTEETRIRHMDYGIQFNGYLYAKLLRKENIVLFSPDQVPGLYEAFFADQPLFATLYEKYSKMRSIRKKVVPASDIFSLFIGERNNTSRIYAHNVDHTNEHGSFLPATSPTRMSNLCVEITTPTSPLTRRSREVCDAAAFEKYQNMEYNEFIDTFGEVSLCTLGSINWGVIQSPEDFKKPAMLLIRMLNEILDYQEYPMVAAGIPAKKRRNLGIGVSNLAYFIAKRGFKYSDGSANETINEYAEAMSYWLISASSQVAKEKGKPCDWFDETKYSQGIFPIDTYKKAVDELVDTPSHMDWDSLRDHVKTYGMYNSTVMALMPVESSSQLINATNGIEPPRQAITVKLSKDGKLKQVIPEIFRLKNKYEFLWDMPNTRGYLGIAGLFQKWGDQSISTNTTYNPKNYPNSMVPESALLGDLIYAYKIGLKTLYYQNTNDGAGEVEEESEEDCAACKL